jgi:hypothetical protein
MLELWQKKNIQGFCYDCFIPVLQGDWIMKPELSTAHLGIQDRDLRRKSVQATAYCLFSFVAKSKWA